MKQKNWDFWSTFLMKKDSTHDDKIKNLYFDPLRKPFHAQEMLIINYTINYTV